MEQVAAFGQASTCKDLNNLSDIKLIQTLHRLLLYLNDGMAPLINNAEEYTPGKSTDMNNDKQSRAIQTRSFNATWALLRNFGISMAWSAARMEEVKQHGHAPIHPAIQLENKTIVGLFCVYQDVGWRALARLRDANAMDLKLSASNNQHVDNPNSISSHPRRCQEIISTPMRLASSDDGIQIGAENIISNPKGTDLSFTCWLYLLQNTTGYHRVVLLRGTETTFRPILLIRDKDMRLEVGFGSSTCIGGCIPVPLLMVLLHLEATTSVLDLKMCAWITQVRSTMKSSILTSAQQMLLPLCLIRSTRGLQYH